ncbi:efflux RND transporter periplasmic adaptor subunit [Cohnella abietis]|uniref:Membrane protein n=1 Tax=Cohnella abietis TaxID=2507935 RepID=A0A3T1DB76_9BACL|nr:efflux RND transporter periplasmic adaptor subunit [Cohnella abietis]BBI35339.1 membrane protein [Cohnella abietis]
MFRTIKQAAALGLAIVLSSTLAGCSLLPQEEEALKPPLVKPAQENYTTVKVEKGSIVKAISSSGSFESIRTDISQFTGEGGRIDKILVKQGDTVKKGDILVQLILDGLDLQLKEQQLELEKARYAFRQTQDSDDQALSIAKLKLEIEQIKYEKLSKKFNSKQLYAGIDGQVTFVETLKAGDNVDAYQTLVIIADPSQLRIALRVDNPNDIREVDVGATADITLNDEKVVGKVVQTPSSSPTTLNKDLAEKYAKTLYIEVPKLPLKAEIGSIAGVKIITQELDDVLKIPRSGLRSYLGRNFVRVLEDGKSLREIDVEPGLVGSTEVEIIKGLQVDQVIVLQ